jgi:hypothetical protein
MSYADEEYADALASMKIEEKQMHEPHCRSRSCPGCGYDSEIARLKREVKELTTENKKLRIELRTLKEQSNEETN